MQTGPFFSSSRSEERWVTNISRNYTINLKTCPCIFQVPQKLRDEKPEAYTPQALGLGPYHHLRPELQKMESLKRASVKAFLSDELFKNFIQSVENVPLKFGTGNGLLIFQSKILPHYDTYVDLDSKTLAWILVIDGIFLLQFLNEKKNWEDQRMVADLMMLENQIPMALLEEINKVLQKNSFPDVVGHTLLNRFEKFCDRHTPLKLHKDSQREAFADKKHLLHFLYRSIVENFTTETPTPPKSTSGWDRVWEILKSPGFAKQVADNFTSAMGEARDRGLRLPQPINHLSKLLEQLQKASDLYGNGDNILQQRLAQEIDVPSVSQLHVIAKIKFARTDGGVRNISFNKDTLYLPEITLRETSEIILRNLLAYEAATKPAGSILELKEYVDLMCGIIKAENDVNLLRQFDIIKGDLSDRQIVCIFNGINKTTKIPPEQSDTQRIVQKLSKLLRQKTSDSDPCESGEKKDDQNPLVNKIEVPSASKLNQEAELKFICIYGGKRNILFDEKKNTEISTLSLPEISTLSFPEINHERRTLSLPEINHEKNTLYLPEINLGNDPKATVKKLAQAEPEYVDFMCAIIKLDGDADLLKKKGIIKGDDNLTKEQIFNAFAENRKSIEWPIELTGVQETVQKLNKKFRDIRIVKAYKFMENSCATFQSWIKMIFPTLVLLILTLQSFCEIYGCGARRSGSLAVPGDSSFGADGSEVKLMMPRKFLRYDLNQM